jgi:hypothetical protein
VGSVDRIVARAKASRLRNNRGAGVNTDRPQDHAGKQILPRRRDPGGGANATPDGLDDNNEALRHAAKDTPFSGISADAELVPVFNEALAETRIYRPRPQSALAAASRANLKAFNRSRFS